MARKARKGQDSAKSTSVEAETTSRTATLADSRRTPRKTWSLVFDANVQRAFYLVLLAAMYAPLSQLILAPVYGSVPSAVYHKYGVVISAVLSFMIKGHVSLKVEQFFPAFVFWIPIIHLVLFSFSSVFGNPIGPLITEWLTTFPLIMISIYLANKYLHKLDLGFLNEGAAEVVPSMYNYFLFTVLQRLLRSILPTWMGLNKFFSRVGLQVIAGAAYASVVPQSFFWPALPAIAFSAISNVHTPLLKTTELLNNTLALYNYSLVERHESLTGYISVLQDNANNFRVMRCDHSLLGGEWILPPDPKGHRRLAEPVFAVFTMLESVRLVERDDSSNAGGERALNIGLGVGTAPSALITHGVNTTIIELDPVVYRFAVEHFGLPTNHRAYIGDAVRVVEAKKEEQQGYYDYIIHDVFTGGAEPVDLFTVEFLSGLDQMLKADGAIAINYAGDLAMSSTSLIYRTITEVFPSCRVFREDEQVGEEGMKARDENGEFTNMVFICRKRGNAVKFRKAVEADFLGSASRRSYMVPKYEVAASRFQRQGELLTKANRKALEKLHVQSAIGHWKLMRKVIPAPIWENW